MDADNYRSGSGGGGMGYYAPQHVQQQQQAQSQQQQQNHHPQQQQQQQQSMTIDEMRLLHRSALADAESKRTELRLVLASRYRELVGSSDEVTHMRERAEELYELVLALPGLVERVVDCAAGVGGGEASTSGGGDHAAVPPPPAVATTTTGTTATGRADAAAAPRTVKLARRALLRSAAGSGRVVGGARITAEAISALDLLDVNRRSGGGGDGDAGGSSSTRATKLVDLYYESKAALLNRLLNKLALPPPPTSTTTGGGPASSASSSSALDAASVTNRAEVILSKIVTILQYDVILYPYQIFVLRKFRVDDDDAGGDGDDGGGKGANGQNRYSASFDADGIVDSIMSTLPSFDPDVLKSKASRFLAAHLPLISTKVKSVLVMIAGTTASKLGHIRQTLYDKTDGAECMAVLDACGVCGWDEAVGGMVDVRVVSHGTTFAAASATTTGGSGTSVGDERGGGSANATAAAAATARRFSLWGALFSNTFSSLVHSLLTSSFHSVHVRVVSTLRASLARAPPFESMLPHEAHRNALRIATDLDASLRRVSDDAHELLVHAEEREESERRLRQSLYVQTCEIMGRLLNELRRMLVVADGGTNEKDDATKVLIVGRLCHLLKFRLKSLPTLLDPKSSPAVMLAGGLGGGGGGKSHSGMITLMELSSSFDLADDDDDGLISFDEAMEAMESAFSGTHFHGAEMVRDTLLLAHSAAGSGLGGVSNGVTNHAGASYASNGHNKSTPQNVTLSELALLSARGLRHDASGPESALGTVQSSLDDIVNRCFKEWARAALSPPLKSFKKTLQEHMGVAMTVSDMEWRRLHGLIGKEDDTLLKEISESKGDESIMTQSQLVVGEVSPHVVSYLLAVAGVLNRSVCPADSLPPVPSLEYADKLGISSRSDDNKGIPNMLVTIRGSLLGEALTSLTHSMNEEIMSTLDDDCVTDDGNVRERLKKCSTSSLVQLNMDVRFIRRCFFDRNKFGFSLTSDTIKDSCGIIDGMSERLSMSINSAMRDTSIVNSAISERHAQVFCSCDLFLSSLFGEDQDGKFSSATSVSMNGVSSSVLSSSESFVLNPLPSSRRFILLPIQAEKSLTELQLRGKYGKKTQEEKSSGKDSTSGALGTGFGFLSSMLTKTR
ncbi:hypothetical protein ACHAW5_010154 [Stephanodiscus triporus]|uniref:Conserved oligomeric Golgi complex subunit 1 n=1 Tax=Stephanodiscus triporus TaxID=2934178 RepID=A0ABD3NPV1_9STRA